MRVGDTKLFIKNPEKLSAAINLRLNGWSITSLSTIYNCDRSSLRYQFEKYQIVPRQEVFNVEDLIIPIVKIQAPKERNWRRIDGEKVNTGKYYSDYVQKRVHIPIGSI